MLAFNQTCPIYFVIQINITNLLKVASPKTVYKDV